MSTLFIYGELADGYITSGTNSDFELVRTGVSLAANTSLSQIRVGQEKLSANYLIYQGFLSFSIGTAISSLGLITVNSLTLQASVQTNNSATDFVVETRASDWVPTLGTASWTAGTSIVTKTLYGRRETSTLAAGYNTLASGTPLSDYVLSAATASFMLSSDRQGTALAVPTGLESVYFYSANQSGTTSDPKLVLDYTERWALYVDGSDYINNAELQQLEISDTSGQSNGRLSATYHGITGSFSVPPAGSVSLQRGTATEWAGRIVSRAVSPNAVGYMVDLTAADLAAELDGCYVVGYTSGTAIRTDKAIIQELFTTYGTSISVTAPDATVIASGAQITDIAIDAKSLRQSVEDVVSATVANGDLATTWVPVTATNFSSGDTLAAGSAFFAVPGYSLDARPTMYASADGVAWSTASRSSGAVSDTVTVSGTAVVLGRGADLWTSASGTAWTGPSFVTGRKGYAALTQLGGVATSSNGFSWQQRWSGASGGEGGLCYAADKDLLVAVGWFWNSSVSNHTFDRSSDGGVTWSYAATAGSGMHAVTYAQALGLFVAVGSGGAIYSSTDAITWTSRTSGTTSDLYAVTYSATGGFFAVGGDGGKLLTSTSGTASWTSRTFGSTGDIRGLTWGSAANLVVAVTMLGDIRTSANGTAWTERRGADNLSLRAVAYSDDQQRFVAVGHPSRFLKSNDGLTWSTATTSGLQNQYQYFAGVTYSKGDSLWFATGSNEYATSTDGSAWTMRSNPVYEFLGAVVYTGPSVDLNSIAYGTATYVAVGSGGSAYLSTDRTTWTAHAVGSTATMNAITYGTAFVAVGAGGTAYTSTNGTAWTGYSIGTATMNGVAYGTATYVAVGNGGNIYYSASGTAWSTASSTVSTDLTRVRYVQNRFVAVGASGVIATSTSGTAFVAREAPTTSTVRDVAYASNAAVAVGSAATLLRSTAGPGVVNYFVDTAGRLNYNTTLGTAPYAISDAPDGTTSIAPVDLTIDYDESNIVNAVFVASAASDWLYGRWVYDQPSISAYGRRDAFVADDGAIDSASAELIGNAYLADRKDPTVRGSFTVVGKDGWKAGQTLTITSSALALTRATYEITQVDTSFLTGTGTRAYRVSFGALPKSLVRLLAAT